MSLHRCVAPVAAPSAFLRFAAQATSRPVTHATRQFTSSIGVRQSSKRKLVTSAAYHPQSLDPSPPPRNTGVPDSSIAGALPQANDLRPPQSHEQKADSTSSAAREPPAASVTEKEAQKSKPKTELPEVATSTEAPTKPKRSKLRPRKAAMNLTPTAVAHMRRLLSQPDPRLIRVGVKNRGCSGLAYHLEYVEKPGMFDEVVEQDGVKVLIDSKALFSIIGSEMDWVSDKLNERFVFRNPNIKEQCGCGESFMV